MGGRTTLLAVGSMASNGRIPVGGGQSDGHRTARVIGIIGLSVLGATWGDKGGIRRGKAMRTIDGPCGTKRKKERSRGRGLAT